MGDAAEPLSPVSLVQACAAQLGQHAVP